VAAALAAGCPVVLKPAEDTPLIAYLLAEAVDAVDDGLAADVTLGRLTRALGDRIDPTTRVRRRVEELVASA
jgi:acyl-CoA reductase-like NAD-dependent aldehyde dehydrogenase